MTTLDPGVRARPGPARPAARRPARVTEPAKLPLLGRPLASYYLVLSSAGLLLVLGLVMVLSASSVRSYAQNGSSFTIFYQQATWVALGLPVLIVTSRSSIRRIRLLAYPLMITAVFLLMAVLVPGVGVSINQSRRWIGVGSYTVQPSEIAKLALVIWGADLLVRKQKRLGEWKHLLVPLVPVGAWCCLLVMLEPDMGTTIVLLCALMTLLWVVGAPGKMFAAVSATVLTIGGLLAVMEPYRFERLTSYTDPFKTAQTTGFQAVQGLYALASGGWWGEGLGASREKWPQLLPNAHTDFILAIIGEELGLLGTLLLVALFVVLAYAGVRVAHRSADPFARLAAAAATAWIVGQAVVNMGAVVGLLPITGIPLPLVSAGGSALVPTMFVVGMLLSFARAEPAAAEALLARKVRRRELRSERRESRRERVRAVVRNSRDRLHGTPSPDLLGEDILVAPPREARPNRSVRPAATTATTGPLRRPSAGSAGRRPAGPAGRRAAR